MKKISLQKLKTLEHSSVISNQKSALIKLLLIFLILFCFCMGGFYFFKSNTITFFILIFLLFVYICEFILLQFVSHPSKLFAIGAIITLTGLLCYILMTSTNRVDSIWFWFLAIPSLTTYVCSIFWSFSTILYGQTILVLLLWTPLSEHILTESTEYLNRLPIIYFVISISCLAISYTFFQYQWKQHEEHQKMIHRLSAETEHRRIDRMTDLLNRDFSIEPIEEALRKNVSCAFFLMDIDNFKLINDTKGHLAGDTALKNFADIMKQVFPKDAILVRLGGDEFVAFISHYTHIEELKDYADQMLAQAKNIVQDSSLFDKIGVSIGVSLSPKDGTSFSDLSSSADKAQYFAKRNGKNRYSFYARDPITPVSQVTGATIDTIRRMVQSVWLERGAYSIEYSSFGTIYQFLERNLSRNKQQTQILLFTLHPEEVKDYDNQKLLDCYDSLCASIQFSLRTSDLMLKFNQHQALALLINCTSSNGKCVATRILESYFHSNPDHLVPVTYELGSVNEVGIESEK